MAQIANQMLTDLLMQLRFAPQAKRASQLEAAERLYQLIEPDRQYPFEFVCFHITGFRPKDTAATQIVPGRQLLTDLQVFIAGLSSQLSVPVVKQPGKVYTIGQLTEKFSVSRKTIDRWRSKKGLLGRKYLFPDGRKRWGFLESAVERFAGRCPELLAKAAHFTRLRSEEKKRIADRAAVLCRKGTLTRRQIIKKIASELARAQETVRYTLAAFEKQHPLPESTGSLPGGILRTQHTFDKPFGVVTSQQAKQIHEMFTNGQSVSQLMQTFRRSKSSIYRIIRHRKARDLLARKIEFIPSQEFSAPYAAQQILKTELPPKPLCDESVPGAPGPETKVSVCPLKSRPLNDSLPQYLQAIKVVPLLTRQAEQELFRRYNFLKYLACIKRTVINPAAPNSAQIRQVQARLDEAEQVKNQLIGANLRLVVSVAKKHLGSAASLLDLISEGNLALMQAVEKFDYTRGFRFCTYASWAIAKAFARMIPAETYRPDRAGAIQLRDDLYRDMRSADVTSITAIEDAHRSLEEVIKNNLDEREQYVILHHFGLVGTSVKKKFKTFRQIGQDLGLSKERTRQIELMALQKLRHCLSPEEFDLLTG